MIDRGITVLKRERISVVIGGKITLVKMVHIPVVIGNKITVMKREDI